MRLSHDRSYIAGDFQQEIAFLGIKDAASYVREPQGKGMAKRFLRIIKGNKLWACSISTIKKLRLALMIFK